MSNISDYNYGNIDQPYNDVLERSDVGVVNGGTGDTDGSGSTIGGGVIGVSGVSEDETAVENPADIDAGSVDSGKLANLWINSWIKSNNYAPKTRGFLIDGLRGYIECMKLYVGDGGIVGGSLDVPDATTANSWHVDSTGNMWSGATTFNIATNPFAVSNAGVIRAASGTIGGFTLGATEMYGGIIKTAATVGVGSTGVIMDTDGLRGYDSILGNTFELPTDGGAPTFSSGIINETIYEISTNAILRTASTVGDGTANSAGTLINSTGVYICEANQAVADANFKALIDGTISLKGSLTITGGSGIASLTDAGDLVTVNEADVDALNLTNGPAAANADVTKTIIDAGMITTGYITLGTAGNIKSGKTTYADTTAGLWLGSDGATPKFSIGDATEYMKWDGTTLTIAGAISASTINIPNATTPLFSIDSSGNVIAKSLRRDDFHWFTVFESIDSYQTDFNGGASAVRLNTGGFLDMITDTTAGDYAQISKKMTYQDDDLTWANKRSFKAGVATISAVTSSRQLIGTGYCNEEGGETDLIAERICFRFNAGTLYGFVSDGSAYSTLDCGAYTASTKYTVEAIFDPGVGVEFFVNNVSKGTITTNLPTNADNANIMFSSYVETRTGSAKYLYISYFDFWQAQ